MKYIVRVGKRGLDGVMRDYNITRDKLRALNSIDIDNIRPGMLMTIDVEDDIEHIVKPFETIEKIADKYGVTANYIREYNDIQSVFLGDKVYIERNMTANKS